MTIAIGQHAWATNYGAAATTTAVTTNATGSSFVIFTLIGSLGSPSVSDSFGNTYSLVGTTGSADGFTTVAVYLCTNGTGGAGHTATSATQPSNNVVFFGEITGGALSSLVDQIASPQWNDDTSSPFTSNTTGATTQANEICLAFTTTSTASGTETLNWSANG